MHLDDLLVQLASECKASPESVSELVWRMSITHPSYQGELVILLSEDEHWVSIMIPIASSKQAQPFFQELLELNFETTTFITYALAQQMLWGVFKHPLQTLQSENIQTVIDSLIDLQNKGLNHCFEAHADRQVRLIISASKRQGLTLEATLQNLERFYREGIIGDLSDSGETIQLTLSRWRDRLERLWVEENLELI